ncbi:MAG: hydratase [Oscillospiraceae bacterium]|nr:hydratase [Oscillospiraceae bacterium]
MIKLYDRSVRLKNGTPVFEDADLDGGREKTMSRRILRAHAGASEKGLKIKFDSLISHDITYVGIIQTAAASGLTEFPVPYVMTNCHNSLCAVGGTINADDHAFGLSAAKKYGGIYVPANQAVIHQYAREMMTACGGMILGSDSHTRYGALGVMGVGEGGPEIVRQLLGNTYDIDCPETVLVWLTGEPPRGVGPHDAAIALCGAVYKNGFVKNKVLEFAGPGVAALPMDFRIGIDVMTTETAALSSVWVTDGAVEEYYAVHGRPEAFRRLEPGEGAVYDAMIEIDLSSLEPMAALPFHPSEAVTLRELIAQPGDLLREAEKRGEEKLGGRIRLTDKIKNGRLVLDQGVIAGCSGGMYDNIAEAAAILRGRSVGSGGFSLSVYPPSVPVNIELIADGVQQSLLESGAEFKPCFCGPCFGAGEVPENNGLSIRHTTRNFPNREGSRPSDGQLAAVMLMDARSIAATAANGGVLTSAAEFDYTPPQKHARAFNASSYEKRVYFGFGRADAAAELKYGPNITPWPEIPDCGDSLLAELCSVIHDEVTTTDELIPSGETSSYRSNPLKLAEFALSRRDPGYAARSKAAKAFSENMRAAAETLGLGEKELEHTRFGSAIFARKPGDGSAREQAASCQRVLGGCANICYEFATKRYRSNCVNWGILPFTLDRDVQFAHKTGDCLYVPGIRKALMNMDRDIPAKIVSGGTVSDITLHLYGLTEEERDILLAGCLMNWYARTGK